MTKKGRRSALANLPSRDPAAPSRPKRLDRRARAILRTGTAIAFR
ncbi:hypothetical protein [Rhizorhabdus wittichii]|nr:hypothetical protein [Rhizorhabdus wittichii]